ncbi:AMP-binding protein [Murimonas intestini]|uniref:AMP-binding protein n=2 Tax=Murimonas intestini TaxID=1337051 RepID=UPI001FA98C48|nr:AMP-binding protein [Murimonas intestini]
MNMLSNMLEYLELTVKRVPDRVAFYDDQESMTFAELEDKAGRIGTALALSVLPCSPVALLMDSRSINNIPAMYGVLCAGGAYAPLDISMPPKRLAQLLGLLEPKMILADEKGEKALEALGQVEIPVLSYDNAVRTETDHELLKQIRKSTSVYDAMSILYTSGSTGVPKGSVQTHFSYLHWTEATIEVYGLDENVVFGNQSPFFYANSIIDIFPPIALGATVYLLPSGVLTFPKKFIECLNSHHVTELTMTPSSFVGVANAGVLDKNCLPELRYGIMSGESMPWEPLKVWMQAASGADWWHFYGSTEMFSVAVGKVEGEPRQGEPLAVGRPFSQVHILFVDEEGNEVDNGVPGEMLVSSPWIAAGYHRDAGRTQEAWIDDPMDRGWHERFFRAGDLGYFRKDGQLVVTGRRDTQIKHMGYRMELGEVEAALRRIPGWRDGCVLFHKPTGKIWCFFTGELRDQQLKQGLKTRLARYMLPDVFVHLDEMPHTASLKLDRAALTAMMEMHE